MNDGRFKSKGSNFFVLKNGEITVYLEKDRYCRLDFDDWIRLGERRLWWKEGYVLFSEPITNLGIPVHRFITGYRLTDHINRCKWDNRKANLREASIQQNGFNKAVFKNNSSGYKGVTHAIYRGKRIDKWKARIRHHDKLIYLGVFQTKEEAALAYNRKAIELFGEFACLNEIEYN